MFKRVKVKKGDSVKVIAGGKQGQAGNGLVRRPQVRSREDRGRQHGEEARQAWTCQPARWHRKRMEAEHPHFECDGRGRRGQRHPSWSSSWRRWQARSLF